MAVTAFALPARAASRRYNAPSAVSLRPIVTAANRSRAAARLEDRLVRDDSTFPPDILLPGAKQSQDVKCLALRHARRSVPHSPTSLSDRDGPIPWSCVRSTPRTPNSAAPTSNEGVLGSVIPIERGFERLS